MEFSGTDVAAGRDTAKTHTQRRKYITLIRKIRAAAADPPFILFQHVLDKITLGSIQVRKFYLLEFAGLPNIIKTRGPGLVRKGLVSDIPEMANLDYYEKQAIFEDRFSSGDHCVVAVVNGNIVGYEWFSSKLFHREERYLYTIPVPDNAIYAYDAFLVPAYRGSGVWIKFKKYLGELMSAQGRTRIITLIDAENRLSLNTHIRFGFTASSGIVLIKLFQYKIFQEKKIRPAVAQRPRNINMNISTPSAGKGE